MYLQCSIGAEISDHGKFCRALVQDRYETLGGPDQVFLKRTSPVPGQIPKTKRTWWLAHQVSAFFPVPDQKSFWGLVLSLVSSTKSTRLKTYVDFFCTKARCGKTENSYDAKLLHFRWSSTEMNEPCFYTNAICKNYFGAECAAYLPAMVFEFAIITPVQELLVQVGKLRIDRVVDLDVGFSTPKPNKCFQSLVRFSTESCWKIANKHHVLAINSEQTS